jgi:hypothetical protein
MITIVDRLTAARAAALFASDLSAGVPVDPATIHAAIAHAIRGWGGSRGCAAEVAAAYGERPETAVPRMRWALSTVGGVYPRSGRRSATR